MLDELVDFFKGAFVEKEFDAFTSSQFALAVLAFAPFRASALFSGSVSACKFFEAIHSSSEYRATAFSGAGREIIETCERPSICPMNLCKRPDVGQLRLE